MKEILIDGSAGEGGGQILRTSLSLSGVTGVPFRIEKIRAGRKKPGLLRQHLTAVEAAARIAGAEMQGAKLGSTELSFRPAGLFGGEYRFAVGTAGSASLVLQTILPMLLRADRASRVVLEGGTHNPAAPPYDFVERAFLPRLSEMGAKVNLRLERRGFHPAGGGRIVLEVEPAELRPLHVAARGEIRTRRAVAILSAIPRHVAEREIERLTRLLGWDVDCYSIDSETASPGPGNVLVADLGWDGGCESFASFGERGVRAEQVADRLVEEIRRFLVAEVPVGEHLADQLLLPMALAGGGSFETLPLTPHSRTNLDVIARFLPVPISVEPTERRSVRVRIG